MVFNWDTVPLLRILLPFLMGILLFTNSPLPNYLTSTHLLSIAIFSMLVLFLCYQQSQQKLTYRYRWVFGAIATFLLLIGGFVRTQQMTDILQKNHFSHFLTDSSHVLMQIETPIEERAKTYKAEVKILEVVNGPQSQSVIGKALVYFEKSTEVSDLQYGDIVLSNSLFKQLEKPKNPHAFDYAAYMRNFQVYHQAYLPTGKWYKTDRNDAKPFFESIYQTRAYFLKIIEEKVGSPAEIGVASAILLGYKGNLDEEVRETYANTGAMHILAVSGLHVGIIFIILGWTLSFIDRLHKRGKQIKFVFVIVLMWGYAFLTGLPPSVFRATTMFTIFGIGKILNRKAFSFNSLAASALILLCYNPYMIKMVGFQLSYSAVAAIMWLQSPIYQFFTAKNKLLDYGWKISSVSIAAQLGTAPLSMYYFHQFPTYFWISNLIVIPAASLILSVGIGLLIFGAVPYLGDWIGILLEGIIQIVYKLLQFIQFLPFSTVEGLVIGEVQFWLLYGAMASVVFYCLSNQVQHFKIGLATIVLMIGAHGFQDLQSIQQKQIVVYHAPKNGVLELIGGKQSHLIGGETLLEGEQNKTFQYNIAPNQLMAGIQKSELISSFSMNNWQSQPNLHVELPFLQFYDKTILLLNETSPLPNHLDEKLEVDYLILTQNVRFSLKRALDWLVVREKIIFDTSNKYQKIQRWQSECAEYGLDCYNVYEQGAFVVKF